VGHPSRRKSSSLFTSLNGDSSSILHVSISRDNRPVRLRHSTNHYSFKLSSAKFRPLPTGVTSNRVAEWCCCRPEPHFQEASRTCQYGATDKEHDVKSDIPISRCSGIIVDRIGDVPDHRQRNPHHPAVWDLHLPRAFSGPE
jgi:hypothetical protein